MIDKKARKAIKKHVEVKKGGGGDGRKSNSGPEEPGATNKIVLG